MVARSLWATLIVLAVAPAAAPAAELRVNADVPSVYFQAAPGERNELRIARRDQTISFTDPGASITGTGHTFYCSQRLPHRIVCTFSRRTLPSTVYAELGDGDDSVVQPSRGYDAVFMHVMGGDGDDRLRGGAGIDTLFGNAGDDLLAGGDSGDHLTGGLGNDRLRGGAGTDSLAGESWGVPLPTGDEPVGRDDLAGGTGSDIALIQGHRRQRVAVTLDGRANDGVRAERDYIHRDVENAMVATSGSATVVGNRDPNLLALSGTGTVRGRGGADDLSGAGRQFGGAGDDTLRIAGAGTFDGGSGDDTLTKEAGVSESTRMRGGAGDDTISSVDTTCDDIGCYARSVVDRVSCGTGRDRARPGARDVVSRDCERVAPRR